MTTFSFSNKSIFGFWFLFQFSFFIPSLIKVKALPVTKFNKVQWNWALVGKSTKKDFQNKELTPCCQVKLYLILSRKLVGFSIQWIHHCTPNDKIRMPGFGEKNGWDQGLNRVSHVDCYTTKTMARFKSSWGFSRCNGPFPDFFSWPLIDPGDETLPFPAPCTGGERAEPVPTGPELASTLIGFVHMFIRVGDDEAELDPVEQGPRFNPGLRLRLPARPGLGMVWSNFEPSCCCCCCCSWACCCCCCCGVMPDTWGGSRYPDKVIQSMSDEKFFYRSSQQKKIWLWFQN